jgi:preprotein translocase subunit YajC
MGPMTIAAGHLAVTTQKSSGGSPLTLIILVGGFVLIYLLFMRPQRARQRRIQQQQSEVLPGQRIRTTAGMYGTVVSGDARDVVIEISPGVHVTMLRRAIMEVIPDDAPADLVQDGEMPHHEDLAPDEAEVPEQDSDATPADGRDLKDRNV